MARIQTKTANNGAGGTSCSITMDAAPTDGNLLVMTVATSGTATGRVSSITQTGASWARATEIAKTGVTCEIWYAMNVSGAATGITVNLASSIIAICTVLEYSAMATTSALDKIASNSADYGGGGE